MRLCVCHMITCVLDGVCCVCVNMNCKLESVGQEKFIECSIILHFDSTRVFHLPWCPALCFVQSPSCFHHLANALRLNASLLLLHFIRIHRGRPSPASVINCGPNQMMCLPSASAVLIYSQLIIRREIIIINLLNISVVLPAVVHVLPFAAFEISALGDSVAPHIGHTMAQSSFIFDEAFHRQVEQCSLPCG